MAISIQLEGNENDTGPEVNTDNMQVQEMDSGGYRVTQQEQLPETSRPAKFKTDAEYRKAYDELERKFHSQGQPSEEEDANEPDVEPTNEEEGGDPTQSGVENDFSTYETEFSTDGALSDKSYKELAAKGLPKNIVDQYIEGRQLANQQARSELLSVVGGEEQFTAMAGWARANYSDAEANAFNEAINSGDPAKAKLAMKGLKADYGEAKGIVGETVKGGKNNKVAQGGFRSQAEVTAAMKDPRYDRDPAYRDDVVQKLQRSQFMQTGAR